MAEEVKHSQTDTTGTEEGESLKRLEFVQVGALNALGRFSNLYGYAKEKTGPLKSGVDTLEGTVKSVVGPVYSKFQDVPTEVLKYVDRKVDESVTKLDSSVPPVLKQVPAQALSAAQMVPALAKQVPAQALSAAQMVPALAKQVPAQALSAAQMVPALAKQVPAQVLSAAQRVPALAQSVVSEMKCAGVVEIVSAIAKRMYTKYESIAKGIYTKYEPKAEQCAVSAWKKLNQLPLFPRVAQVVVPTAAYCTEKYNQTVSSTAEKGYRVSSYLPLVPTEKIAKMFNDEVAEPEPLVPAGREVDAAAVH